MRANSKIEKSTERRGYEHGTVVAQYGFERIGEQEPYFHVVCDTFDKRGREDGGGAAHELIARVFPEIAPLIKWHLCSWPKGPMHYVANGLWWWEHLTGARIVEYPREHGTSHAAAWAYFCSTVVYGAVEGDDIMSDAHLCDLQRSEVQAWLEARLPALMEAFKKDVVGAGFADVVE